MESLRPILPSLHEGLTNEHANMPMCGGLPPYHTPTPNPVTPTSAHEHQEILLKHKNQYHSAPAASSPTGTFSSNDPNQQDSRHPSALTQQILHTTTGPSTHHQARLPAQVRTSSTYTWLQESYQWTPPRTLDPDHNPPTSHGTTWIELLNQPNTSITTIRGAMIRPRISLGLSPSLKDTMYRVQMDFFLIGPRRCLKPLPTKGICDLCWYQDGIRTPENIKHILMECPHSSPTISAHLRLLACCASRRGSQEATQMPTQTFLQTFARRIIFGCIDFEPVQFYCPPEVVVTLAAAVQQCTLKRRDSNAHPTILGSPPESSPSTLLNNIIARFSLAASSTYIKAKQENDRHQIFYPDRPSKETPIEKWTKIWVESGAVRITNNGRLYSILIPTPTISTLHHGPPPNPGFGPGPGPGPDPGPGPGPGHDSDPSTDTDATEPDTDTDTNPDSDHNTEYESDSSQPATTSPHQIHKITLQHSGGY